MENRKEGPRSNKWILLRSPPVAPPAPGAPVFPSQSNFGTMRNPSQYQSQEAISSSGTAPVSNGRLIGEIMSHDLMTYKRTYDYNFRLSGRPTVAPPPRPPPNKPPPPPLRSVSNQNLPQMPLSTPTTNTLNSAASANNVSLLKEQLKHHIGMGPAGGGGTGGGNGGSTPNVEKVVNGNGNGVAPPLPPHRTCPAPPPPNANRQISNVRQWLSYQLLSNCPSLSVGCWLINPHLSLLHRIPHQVQCHLYHRSDTLR